MIEEKLREYNEQEVWKSEVEWLFRLMPSDVLLKLKDVIEFAIEEKEYEKCPISCGGMRGMVEMIEKELRIRRMEEKGMTYREANEVIIAEKQSVWKKEEEQVIDDRSNGQDKEEGRTDSI